MATLSELNEFQLALNDAQDTIRKQDELLRQLTAQPLGYAVIIAVHQKSVTIGHENSQLEVQIPPNTLLAPGIVVTLNLQTMQIVGTVSPNYHRLGNVSTVLGVVSKNTVEVTLGDSTRVVATGTQKVEKGDRVLLDEMGWVITQNLGKEQDLFSAAYLTQVSWDDIGGLAEAKRQLIEVIELPRQFPEVYGYYKKKPAKGILLYGPPGCGKTMLGQAAATSIASTAAGQSAFMAIKGPEILSRWVSVAEETIRQVFARAKHHQKTTGTNAVIFIDEAESILAKRGSGISSDLERTIVPTFLAEMQGLDESGALVILATNQPHLLDPAVIRDGRIDYKIRVDRPTETQAQEIFHTYLKPIPCQAAQSRQNLAKLGARELFSPARLLYQLECQDQRTYPFQLGHLASGAMIANIVQHALANGIRRDLGKSRPSGLCAGDLESAIHLVEQQNLDMNHDDALTDYLRDLGQTPVSIKHAKELRHAAVQTA